MAYNAGSAFIQLVPSFKGFVDKTDAMMAKAGDQAGQVFAKAFNARLAKSTDAPIGPSDRQSTDQGAKAAGKFADGFRARLAAALKNLPEADITADSSDADRKVAALRAELAELSSKRIGVDLSDTAALVKVAELQAELEALAAESPDLRVQVDTAGAAGELAKLAASMDTASTSAASLDKATSKAGKSAADASSGVSKLGSAAVIAAPAIAEVATVAAGTLAAVAAAAGIAAVGVGAFALAAASDFKQADTQAKAMLTTFQQANQAAVLPVIEAGLATLPDLFSLLTPLVRGTSTALVGLEGEVQKALGSPYWTSFAAFLGSQAGPALTSFGKLLGGTATAVAGLDRAFAPFVSDIEAGMSHLGSELTAFGRGATTNNGISSFVNYLDTEGPRVARTLEDVAGAVLTVARNAGPLAGVLLDIVDQAARFVSVIGNADPTLIQMAATLYTAKKAADLFGIGLGTLRRAATDLGNFRELAAGTVTAESRLGSMVSTMGKVGTAGKAAAEGEKAAGLGLAGLLGPIGLAAAGVTAIIGLFDHSSQAAQQAKDDAEQWANAFVQQVQQTTASSGEQEAAIRREITALNEQTAALGVLAFTHVGLTSAAGKTAEALSKEGITGVDLQLKVQQLKKQLHDLIVNSDGTAAAMTPLQRATQSFADAGKDASDAASTLSQKLGVLAGNSLDAQAATLNEQQAVYSITGALKQQGASLFGTNQQSIAAQQSAVSFAQSLYAQLIPALAKNGDSAQQAAGITNGLVGQFDAALQAAGYTTGQIQALNQQYHLTPADVNTAITTSGYDDAANKAQNVYDKVTAIPNKKIVAIDVQFAAEGQAYAAFGPFHAAGTLSAPGGPSLVGELGPELMITPAGRIAMLGQRGPEVVKVPRGAEIFPASITAQLPRYAAGTPDIAGMLAAAAAGKAGLSAVYVQNPFTGEYLLARMATTAQGVVSAQARDLALRGGRPR